MIKKTLTVLFFFILCTTHFNAQNRFFLGISGGITACQVHGDTLNGFHKMGTMAGIFVHYKWFENFYPQIGIIYIQKGARANPDTIHHAQYLLRLNYIEIPINFKWILLKNRYFLSFGHSVGYLFKAYEEKNYMDITSYVHNQKFEFSINAGLGANLNKYWNVELRSNNSYLPFRYYAFPSNIYYNNPIAKIFNRGLYNNILQLIITYHIYGKEKT